MRIDYTGGVGCHASCVVESSRVIYEAFAHFITTLSPLLQSNSPSLRASHKTEAAHLMTNYSSLPLLWPNPPSWRCRMRSRSPRQPGERAVGYTFVRPVRGRAELQSGGREPEWGTDSYKSPRYSIDYRRHLYSWLLRMSTCTLQFQKSAFILAVDARNRAHGHAMSPSRPASPCNATHELGCNADGLLWARALGSGWQ